jgi:hypothetical protein
MFASMPKLASPAIGSIDYRKHARFLLIMASFLKDQQVWNIEDNEKQLYKTELEH